MAKNLAKKILVAVSVFAFACNAKDDQQKAEQSKDVVETTTPKNEVSNNEQASAGTSSEIRNAAIGYCECFNQNFKTVDPKIQKIFIKAAESPEPLMVLQKEIFSITDPQEQRRLGDEMQKLSSSKEMEACTKKLEQKYKINENDRATQGQVLKALEGKEDCKLVAALMRIGLKQAEMTPGNVPGQ